MAKLAKNSLKECVFVSSAT